MPARIAATFVHAPDPYLSAMQSVAGKYMPLWASTLAAHVPAEDVELSFFDTRFGDVDRIGEADVFLFSGLNQDYQHIRSVLHRLRARWPGATFVIGGPICWSFDQAGDLDRLSEFDHIVLGDGEEQIGGILGNLAERNPCPKVLRAESRFDLADSRPTRRDFVHQYGRSYYGAVIEVSRGCPFLCEFCDIRVMEDNNRSRNKPPALVVGELDAYSRLGFQSFMFACDNFVGDPAWAAELVAEMKLWVDRTGFRPSIFTWITVNVCNYPELMRGMREVGFNTLLIGVESFEQNSLLETAKVQNCTTKDLPEILRSIQSYGFIVSAGLIFGFDSDPENVFRVTREAVRESHLLSVNPNLLMALPGTPLYRRMRLAGRLRGIEAHTKTQLSGQIEDVEQRTEYTVSSNIRYLLPAQSLRDGLMEFIRETSRGSEQFECFRRFMRSLLSGNYVPTRAQGSEGATGYVRSLLQSGSSWVTVVGFLSFAMRPANLWYLARGALLVVRVRGRVEGGWRLYLSWVQCWLDYVRTQGRIRPESFDIESISGPVRNEHILPAGYASQVDEPIPRKKTAAQLRVTQAQLSKILPDPETGCSEDPPERSIEAPSAR